MSAQQREITGEELEDIIHTYDEYVACEIGALKSKVGCFKDLRSKTIRSWGFKSVVKSELDSQIKSLHARSESIGKEVEMYRQTISSYTRHIKEMSAQIKKLERELSMGDDKKQQSCINPMIFAENVCECVEEEEEVPEAFTYTSINSQ